MDHQRLVADCLNTEEMCPTSDKILNSLLQNNLFALLSDLSRFPWADLKEMDAHSH